MLCQRQYLALWTFLLLLQLYRLHKQDESLQFEKSSSKSYSNEDEVLIPPSTIKWRQKRRIWTHVSSTHWTRMMLQEKCLQDKEFEQTFRMTWNSFEQLHARLGTYILAQMNLHRTIYHATRHKISCDHSIKSSIIDAPLSCLVRSQLSRCFFSIQHWSLKCQ